MTSPEKKSFPDFANNPPFKFENSKILETLVPFFKRQHVNHENEMPMACIKMIY